MLKFIKILLVIIVVVVVLFLVSTLLFGGINYTTK